MNAHLENALAAVASAAMIAAPFVLWLMGVPK